ncbi:MAG: M14 family metallopeptidase, partial [Candidatus Latescibacteria bacterium]|nr:M14 family metallopeptidase [Candidatus Latescibacterota bacterium]
MSTLDIQYDHFYTHSEIDTFVHTLAKTYPDFCRVDSLGPSREGRDIHLLTLTDFSTGNPETRPAFVIHGGIHAHEPASAHAPLYTALKLLENHKPDGLLSRITFFIVPRLCPDASEFCISTSTRIRSRTDFENREPNVVYPEDIDNNGLILSIRQQHPGGGFVAAPQEPRLLIQRYPNAPGPYYRLFPEGFVHNWDGSDQILQGGTHSFIPSTPELAGGRSFDWNRNWPYNWRPEQIGAGDYPFSEQELRHFADFLYSHPQIFTILGYHCGKASIIRPPASGSRKDLDPEDDQMLEQLAQMGAALTDTPILRLVTPDNPGKGGHSLDTIYHHLGILGFELELGTVLNDAGLNPEECLNWKEGDEEDWMRRLMAWWDARGQRDPLFEPWQPLDHPQLGKVEVGGFHYTALDNPLVSNLSDTLERTHQFTLKLAEHHPHLTIQDLDVSPLDDQTYCIKLKIANRGKLPTHITNKGKTLTRLQPVRISFVPAKDIVLSSPKNRIDLGHLPARSISRVLEWRVTINNPNTQIFGKLNVHGGAGGTIQQTIGKNDK